MNLSKKPIVIRRAIGILSFLHNLIDAALLDGLNLRVQFVHWRKAHWFIDGRTAENIPVLYKPFPSRRHGVQWSHFSFFAYVPKAHTRKVTRTIVRPYRLTVFLEQVVIILIRLPLQTYTYITSLPGSLLLKWNTSSKMAYFFIIGQNKKINTSKLQIY